VDPSASKDCSFGQLAAARGPAAPICDHDLMIVRSTASDLDMWNWSTATALMAAHLDARSP